MADDFYVYVHRRLVSGVPFYVGKGHGIRAHKHGNRGAHWNRIVAEDGGKDVELIAKDIDEELAFLVEMEAIDKYRRMGIALVNRTNGGQGPAGATRSTEVREKIAAKLRGKTLTDEHKANMSRAMKGRGGRPITKEHREKMVAGLRARGSSNKGKTLSAETRAKISATLKAKGCLPPIGWNSGMKTPQAVIEKRRPALVAAWAKSKADGTRTVSLETRAKMSESAKHRRFTNG